MRLRRKVGMLAGGALLMASAPVGAQQSDLDPGAQLPLAESHDVVRLKPNPRRLYVLDTMFPAAEAAKTYILDGATGKLEGMFNQAYWPNFAVSPDGLELYAVDSYWEKHTRGKRSDYIVVRDAATLQVKEDVALPAGRLLIVSKKYNFDVTPDGRFGLTYNLAPVTAVTVTDLKARKSVGSIPVPGCGLIFAQAPHRFSSLCADGSVITVTFDDAAQGTTKRAEHVFDAKSDPAFEHSGWDKPGHVLYLVTYRGQIIPVILDGDQARAGASWSLTSAAERAQGWRPGGWQVSHVHSKRHELYVLMHQGRDWTHKLSGHEVWVFDAVQGRRTRRIKLAEAAQSVAVSQDEEPLVYVITDSGKIAAYEASSGRELYRTAQVGFTPQLLTVSGE
ncbi:MAG TPA: amine dehydrogenase large subunit [Steroidobacteraceae bacterium]|nr:amine dehydrogenase large subunit [Steroidobacteraceae bacterium]